MFFRKATIGLGAVDPTECFQQVISAYTSYLQIAAEEKTKRREIAAWERTTIKQIKAQRDLLMQYLDRSFDERSENFRFLFAQVDRAMAAGNHEQLALTLDAMVKIAQSSPFKDLANLNSVKKALNDPDHTWKF